MQEAENRNLPHLVLSDTARPEPFTSLSARSSEPLIPSRQPIPHANHLKEQLEGIAEQSEKLREKRKEFGQGDRDFLYLEFESTPNFDLIYKSLENIPVGTELLNVKYVEGKTVALVYVPESKLSHFVKCVEDYLNDEKRTESNKRKREDFINSINNIKLAAVKSLWTDEINIFPKHDESIWWEIWLRTEGKDRGLTVQNFRELSSEINLAVSEQQIDFIDRTVLLIYGSQSRIKESLDLLDSIAELRLAKINSDEFIEFTPDEQAEWVNELLSRLKVSPEYTNSLCILDTGVNNGHPLINNFLDTSDMHSYHPVWHLQDDYGHGTQMAGIALYDDLSKKLLSNNDIDIKYKLESVKILPPPTPAVQNDPQLFGYITSESVSRVEINNPELQRVFGLAITTNDYRDKGAPSSWSASIDNLSYAEDIDLGRLFIVSTGNIEYQEPDRYPEINYEYQIEDPAQSWNAVTVGAYTEKVWLDQNIYPDWTVVAKSGELSPCSRTSVNWDNDWPFKPDIVMEGGNIAWNRASGDIDYPESLSLLTTYYKPNEKLFVCTGDTSAATYLAANICANIQAEYLTFWPETIRALLIHSAEWTNQMKENAADRNGTVDVVKLLRTYGYGVANLTRAKSSAKSSASMIIQENITPYTKDADNNLKTNEMHLHELPWPDEILYKYSDEEVRMKITLSYFIEPNPARRGWNNRHRYASVGLRFDVKTADESTDQFRKRINKAAREDEQKATSRVDTRNWIIGSKLRSRGSVHSDTWQGTAAELAAKGFIAVYPAIGWWRSRPNLGKWNESIRYSLVVTLETPNDEIDIYTPIANKIGVPVEISI